jgi:hypothetical protein
MRFDPEYVVCDEPSLNATSVWVLVWSRDLFNGQRFEVQISSSACPEGLPSHEVAWAAGYYVIERLHDAQLVLGDTLWIGSQANELNDRIDNASRDSKAYLAAKCPRTGCQEWGVAPSSQIVRGNPLPCLSSDTLLACRDGHEFRVGKSDLRVYVKALPPLLDRGMAAT